MEGTIAGNTLITDGIDELFEMESTISNTISSTIKGLAAGANPLALDLLQQIADTAAEHARALAARKTALGGSASSPLAAGAKNGGLPSTPSAALQLAFALLAGVTIRYAALHPVTNRFRDSPITAHEGTTSHLIRAHLQATMAAMGQVAGLIQHAVLAELAAEGRHCQCTCPACGIGLCACGVGARAALNEAWQASRPEPTDGLLLVSHPRPTSAAAAAGIREGDILEEADGAPLMTYSQLQTTLKNHEIGDVVPFQVRRGKKSFEARVRRAPDIGDGTLPLDCEVPSGQVFYLDRARDLQQRLRRRNGKANSKSGITSLSAREIQVLRILADGATNPMIAEKLGISRPTVARHVANILVKLNATNRSEATAIAIAAGFGAEP